MPTGKGANRNNQSICDTSGPMAVNLVKDSSFVIVKKTLRSPSGRTAGDDGNSIDLEAAKYITKVKGQIGQSNQDPPPPPPTSNRCATSSS